MSATAQFFEAPPVLTASNGCVRYIRPIARMAEQFCRQLLTNQVIWFFGIWWVVDRTTDPNHHFSYFVYIPTLPAC